MMEALSLITFALLLGQRDCSILARDPLDCPPGYGSSIDGLDCVKKIRLPTRVPCSEPLIRHGDYELKLGGRMAKFWCEDGRSLVPGNASHAMCSALGLWDREHPRCILVETGGCGELPEEDHLSAFKRRESHGVTTYGFECDPGYDLIGPLIISCNGRLWNGTIPGCTERKDPPLVSKVVLEPTSTEPPEVSEVPILNLEAVQSLPERDNIGHKRSDMPKRLSEFSRSLSSPSQASSSICLLILTKFILQML
eukprot:TRINITY_DN15752_c0_g1_i1.p1 TRINITY_DN15752_c0_g1~~TRINITY_DN15752_c0_g1_i1.p1  ORF type:complete len:253 (+),score=42.96 TRINITY_DN15752_c0_g1_i1:122-880(+)